MFAFDTSIPSGLLVDTETEARKWLDYFLSSWQQNGGLGIDTETTGLARHKDVVIVWSLSDGAHRICLPSQFLELYREPLLENPAIPFDFTNAPFDAHMLANSGVDMSKAGPWRDTRIMSWLRNENNVGRHGLKETTKEIFNRETPAFTTVFGAIPPKRKNQPIITVGDLIRRAMEDPVKRYAAADYASLDAYNTTSLRRWFDEALEKEQMPNGWTLKDFFYNICVPYTKTLWKMERRGITVDAGMLKDMQGPMQEEMLRIEREFARAASSTGTPRVVNLNSPKDVRWFFYELCQKPVSRTTDGGRTGIKNPTTDAEQLEDWAGEGDPWAKMLLEYRGVSKLHGTYVTGLQDWVDWRYRIHTSLNQIGTVTGRLSSSEPNLQNIPRESDRFNIREAFLPGENKRLIVADYEQLEMRLMAHFSRDEKMIDAIKRDIDLHCLTVAEMHGIPYDDVVAAKKADKQHKEGKRGPMTEREKELLEMRQSAKATGFGIIYGIGGASLAAQLTRASSNRVYDEEEGFVLIKKWLDIFPGVRAFMEQTKQEIWRKGYVTTILGRYRRFGDLKGMSKRDAAQAERQSVNSIIQGSAADVAMMAMLKAEHDPELNALGCEMLLQVHDELIFECLDDDRVTQAKTRVKAIMEDPFGWPLLVPLPASAGTGYSWATAK